MPQGSTDKWKFDICCEFDCSADYAKSHGVDCGWDFTKPPCIFTGEHQILNLDISLDELSDKSNGGHNGKKTNG